MPRLIEKAADRLQPIDGTESATEPLSKAGIMKDSISVQQATDMVVEAIEANGTANRREYDVAGIVSELHSIRRSYDFAQLDNSAFWMIVERHALPKVTGPNGLPILPGSPWMDTLASGDAAHRSIDRSLYMIGARN